MNSKKFNRRQVISLLLAILILVAAATPALAWYDEGGENFQKGNTRTTLHPAASVSSVDEFGPPEYPFGLLEGWQ